jgi:hypothetical protein
MEVYLVKQRKRKDSTCPDMGAGTPENRCTEHSNIRALVLGCEAGI